VFGKLVRQLIKKPNNAAGCGCRADMVHASSKERLLDMCRTAVKYRPWLHSGANRSADMEKTVTLAEHWPAMLEALKIN